MAEITVDQAPQDIRTLFHRGFAALEHGNLPYAIDLLTTCVEKEPGLVQARRFLRQAEIRQHRQAGGSALSRLIEAATSLPAYWQASSAAKTGKTMLALGAAEKLLRRNPVSPRYLRLFAEAAVAAELPETAVQTLEVAREHYPEDGDVLMWMGRLFLKVGRTQAARQCFEELCRQRPNAPDAMKALKDAEALHSMETGWKQTADGGGSFQELIKDKHEAQLLEQKSKAVKTDQDVADLIEDVVAKIEKEPGNVNYYRQLARLYTQRRAFDEAVQTLKRALEVSPGDPELDAALSATHFLRFDDEIAALEAAGDAAQAGARRAEREQYRFEDLQARVKRYPNDLRLRFEWGGALLGRNMLNEAIQQFQLAQRSPNHRAKSLYCLAVCLKAKGQYDLAMEQLKTAVSELATMDEAKKEVLYEMGEISETTGKPDEAAEFYKRIYQADIGYKDVAERIDRLYRK